MDIIMSLSICVRAQKIRLMAVERVRLQTPLKNSFGDINFGPFLFQLLINEAHQPGIERNVPLLIAYIANVIKSTARRLGTPNPNALHSTSAYSDL